LADEAFLIVRILIVRIAPISEARGVMQRPAFDKPSKQSFRAENT
jgi:hypothetical protein